MQFLEASRIVAAFGGGPELPVRLLASGTMEPLSIFIRAVGARHERTARLETLPFNTLGQYLRTDQQERHREVALLLPWDLMPVGDWRAGVPPDSPSLDEVRDFSEETLALLRQRADVRILYLPAPLPPIWTSTSQTDAVAAQLLSSVLQTGAKVLPEETFALSGYLTSGCPIRGSALGATAEHVFEAARAESHEPAKVIVTDLDGTLWHGVVGDDGPEGLFYGTDSKGYPHFVYQTLLCRLQASGALLAAVTKNDLDAVRPALKPGRMLLAEEHFVAVMASWHPKAAQIRELSSRLNLGLDSFVFIDDSALELEEVSAALPQVRCMRFPASAGELPAFLRTLAQHFHRDVVTDEDRDRTRLYRQRAEGIAPVGATGSDLTAFLRGLQMKLVVRDRSRGDRSRALQLINKTNQFNLNGHRFSEDDVADILEAGGRLWTGTLADRTGTHGEIFATLVDSAGVARALVMSCRVFNRYVEHAFLRWMAQSGLAPTAFDYAGTPRNTPIRSFLRDLTGTDLDSGLVAVDWDAHSRAFGPTLDSIEISVVFDA